MLLGPHLIHVHTEQRMRPQNHHVLLASFRTLVHLRVAHISLPGPGPGVLHEHEGVLVLVCTGRQLHACCQKERQAIM